MSNLLQSPNKHIAGRMLARLKFEGVHARDSALAAFRGNGLKTYWYRDVVNFGDLLTPLLLRHYGFSPIYDRPQRAQVVATGSILEHLPNDFGGIILGSGFILGESKMSFPHASVLAVRGALTRQRTGRGREVALGDPGLLAPRILSRREPKKFILGIVPHYADKKNPLFASLAARYPKQITLIDVERPPTEVVQNIDQCENVLSSSLHGLIVADSLKIPSGWISLAELWGGRFKFDDYYSAFDLAAECVVIRGDETLSQLLALVTAKPAGRIAAAGDRLHELWSNLGKVA